MRRIILHPLVLLFLSALAIRLVAYFLFNYILFEGEFIHPDSQMYHDRSVEVADSWRRLEPDLVRYPAYVNPVGVLYAIFGPYRILPEGMNLLVGSALPVMLFFLGRKVFSTKVGYTAGILAVIDPLLIYQSTQFLRDILLSFFVLGAIVGAVYWKDRLWISWIGGLLSVFGICFLLNRPTLAAGIVAAFVGTTVLSLAFRRSPLPHWAYTSTVLLVVGLTFLSGSPGTGIGIAEGSPSSSSGNAVLDRINTHGDRLQSPGFTNQFFNELNTGIGPFGSYLEFGLYLPIAGLKALFYPLPWLANSGFELAFGTYMVWWYGLILLGVWGLLVSPWNWAKVLSILLVMVLLVGLGIVGPNMSGLIRWRLPITMIMLIWASQALVWMWDVWRVKCTRGRLTWGL